MLENGKREIENEIIKMKNEQYDLIDKISDMNNSLIYIYNDKTKARLFFGCTAICINIIN